MRPTVKFPDPALSTKCELVLPSEFEDGNIPKLLDDMAETMKAERGIGLAANQVGVLKRIFIMMDYKNKIWEFINPEIITKEGLIQINEGCLSAPGVQVQVPRASLVVVKALDRNGEEFRVACEDLEAVCIQHEIDHLDGVSFLEKTSRNQRRAALRILGLK